MPGLNEFPKAPLNPRMEIPYLRELMKAVNQVIDGKMNSTGEFTCATGVGSTIVENNYCNEKSVILPIATTANAALEQNSGSFYIVAGAKQFTVYHDNNAVSDRTFRYMVIG